MTDCGAIQPRLEEYRYDVVDAAERLGVEAHLARCRDCRGILERITAIEKDLMALSGDEELPREGLERGVDRVRRRLAKAERWKGAIPMIEAAGLLFAVLFWLTGGVVGWRTPAGTAVQEQFEEKKLGVLDHAYGPEERRTQEGLLKPSKVALSPDGQRWAYRAKSGQRALMVVDGRPGPEFDDVDTPFFSPDGKKVAYVAHDSKPNHTSFVVVDGIRGEEFESIYVPRLAPVNDLYVASNWEWVKKTNALEWSPDSRAVVYAGQTRNGICVVVGGKKSETYKEVREWAWSPDGRTLAVAAVAGQDSFVVVGETKGDDFDAVSHLTWSPDGTLAYVAQDGRGNSILVLGDKKSARYPVMGPPVFSPNGKSLGYWISNTPDWNYRTSQLVIDGVVDSRFQVPHHVTVVGNPVFSPDGKHIACKAWQDRLGSDGMWIIVDGKRGKVAFDTVGDPRFSPDGATVAYIGRKGKRSCVVFGDEVGDSFSHVDFPSFSPDGKKVAYVAEKRGKHVVVAGKAMSEEYDEILRGPVFSSDSKKVGFRVRQGDELWSKVLDVK